MWTIAELNGPGTRIGGGTFPRRSRNAGNQEGRRTENEEIVPASRRVYPGGIGFTGQFSPVGQIVPRRRFATLEAQ